MIPLSFMLLPKLPLSKKFNTRIRPDTATSVKSDVRLKWVDADVTEVTESGTYATTYSAALENALSTAQLLGA